MADLENLFQECNKEQEKILEGPEGDQGNICIYTIISEKTFDDIWPSEYITDDVIYDFSDFPHLEYSFSGYFLTRPDDFMFFPIMLDNSIKYGKAMLMVEKSKCIL